MLKPLACLLPPWCLSFRLQEAPAGDGRGTERARKDFKVTQQVRNRDLPQPGQGSFEK